MTDSKKRRMTMLDGLAGPAAHSPGTTPPTAPLGSNRALRAARDAVDAHQVWELDPAKIRDLRIADRIDATDVADLRDAIETNGQAVPILVRRDPDDPDRFLLVYGRRRLEAIRGSDKVQTVRALVAALDDETALRTQISENMARRDLSFIEKALFARQLVDGGFGTQTEVAEVLTVTKSSVSMALALLDMIGEDLVQAIGPAHGIGRPRWNTLASAITDARADRAALCEIASEAYGQAATGVGLEQVDPSVAAFEAVEKALAKRPAPAARKTAAFARKTVRLDGQDSGIIQRNQKGIRIDITADGFADWLEKHGQSALKELHAQWKKGAEE